MILCIYNIQQKIYYELLIIDQNKYTLFIIGQNKYDSKRIPCHDIIIDCTNIYQKL